jgi:hypothetical protein
MFELIDLLAEKLELVQHTGFVGSQFGELGIVEDLHESDLKWGHRSYAIHGESSLIPLAGDAGIAIKEGGNKVSFVAVKVVLGLLTSIVAEQGLGEILVDGGGEAATEHLGSDGHVEEFEPATHCRQEHGYIAVTGAERIGLKAARRRYLVLEKLTQEGEIEPLYDLEDGEFPIEVNGHC